MTSLAIWIIGAIFGAGGAWFSLKQFRRDLNGIGSKATRLERLDNERFNAVCLALLASCPEEKRGTVAGILKIGATL